MGQKITRQVRDVAPTGTNANNDCTNPGNPCKTIGYALSVAKPGELVRLAEGTYTEVNTITKPDLTIQGAGAGKTIVKGSVNTPQPVFTQRANGLKIKNLTLTNDKTMFTGIGVSGAIKDLTVEQVAFENIGSPASNPTSGGTGHGIRLQNDFSNLDIKYCQFNSAYGGIPSVSTGISTSTTAKLSNLILQNCTFRELFAGFVASAAVNGLTITENSFGPMDPSDAFGGSACIQIGDLEGSIQNVRIAQNAFTEYTRGIYINSYSSADPLSSLVKNLQIVENKFDNSLWSSSIRIVTSANATIEQLNIEANTFNQTIPNDFTDGLAVIDIRQATQTASPLSNNIAIHKNCIQFSGGYYEKATWGIMLRGKTYKVQIYQNYFSGGRVGGSTPNAPPTSGIVVQTNFAEPFGSMPAGAELVCNNNYINGFENGLVFYDRETQELGGIPIGAKILIKQNELSNNTLAILTGEDAVALSAPSNWFGLTNPADIAGTVVLGNVDILPILTRSEDSLPGDCGNGFQPGEDSFIPKADTASLNSARFPKPGETLMPNPSYASVAQNFPNPFTGRTILPFWLPKEERVWLRVYDISGRLVFEKSASLPQGPHQFELDANQLREGRMWYYQIGGTDWVETRQMMRF